MYDRVTILDLIDEAEHESPSCACGARMIPVEREGALWLECAESQEPRKGRVSRLVSLDWLARHTRRVILSQTEARAA